MNTIELNTKDGKQIGFRCATGQNLLEAADDANMILPAPCGRGNCGNCYADVTAGDFTLTRHSPSAMEGAKVGGTLLCCTMPKSDLSINVRFNHDRVKAYP